MRDVLDDRTIVIVGSWNIAILNPDWVSRKLFEREGVEVQIVISSGQTNLKYLDRNVSVTPQPDRVVVSALNLSDDSLSRCEAIASKLLELLPVTPTAAVGVNFGYAQDQVPQNIARMFNTFELTELQNRGLAVNRADIIRHLTFEDRELRLRMTMTEEQSLRVHANFHKQVATAGEAREAITGKVLGFRDASEELLRAVYDLEREVD